LRPDSWRQDLLSRLADFLCQAWPAGMAYISARLSDNRQNLCQTSRLDYLKMTVLDYRLTRFLLVGGICYSLNLLLLYCFTAIAGLHYMVSVLLAFIMVNSAGYLMHRRYTFHQGADHFWIGLWKYNLVLLSSCFWVLSLMYILVSWLGVWYLLANIIITIGITGYNFLLHKKWTFM